MMARVLRSAGVAVALLALTACNVSGPPAPVGPRPGEGRLVLYLNGPAAAPLDVTFELASIEAVLEGGGRVPVLSSPIRISALEVVERQILLAESFLPEGRYQRLSLRVSKPRARLDGKWVDLSVPPEGFLLPVAFEVRRGDATALFMSWDIGRTIERQAFFRAAFAFEGRAQELRGVLAYVTNEGSDTLSVIDRSLDRVVAVAAVGQRPRGLAVAGGATRAFVVNAGTSTLSIVDVNTNRVVHSTPLEIGAGASDTVLTPDGRLLYVANTALNSVSVIDAHSFQTVRTVAVGLRPSALAMFPSGAGLLVANSGSNTLSLIDTSRQAVVATIPVDFEPAELAIDAAGLQAFVPHLASPRLSVVSLSSLRTVTSVTVGVASAVLPESDGGVSRLFVAGPQGRRVTLFDVALNTELDSIPVGEDPRWLALDSDRQKLYVVNRGSDTVSVIDRFSRRVRATIPVGKRPYAIAIVP